MSGAIVRALVDEFDRALEALRDVGRFASEAFADVEDASLRERFVSPWGRSYDAEQMLEHAACHPGRHIRQLRRLRAGELW